MKASVFNLEGKAVEEIELPKVFSTPVREDLIARAVFTIQANGRQPYGADPMAGKRSSAHYHGRRRRERWTMMGREMSRQPRLHGKIPGFLMWRARIAPHTVKGREAHPPKVEKVWKKKMNKKERKLAIKSAIAATADASLVKARGHRIADMKMPIVVDDALQSMKKTADLKKFIEAVGLKKELARIQVRKVRAGKGKRRGRKYKKRIGPLIVVKEDKGIGKAVGNLPGVHVSMVENLNAEYLAPGASAGRLTIWTKSAIKNLK